MTTYTMNPRTPPERLDAPCADCGTTVAIRSACPLCGKILCRPCAERPVDCCAAPVTP